MIRRGFLIGFLLAASVMPAARASHARADVRAVAVMDSSDEAAGVSFHLSRTTTYSLFTLEHPSRVVIDLHDARLASGVHLPSGAGILAGIRTASRPNGTLRVVMQLNAAVPATAEWASPGGRGAAPQLWVSIGRKADVAQLGAPRPVHPAHAPADSDRDVVVAVDAGHGGQDPGAIGHGGTREKDVVLAIARALAERINAEPGMRAVLTRDRDEFLLLRERIHRARLRPNSPPRSSRACTTTSSAIPRAARTSRAVRRPVALPCLPAPPPQGRSRRARRSARPRRVRN
jgi:N-acetylmuramoyl-L-alanine amidase